MQTNIFLRNLPRPVHLGARLAMFVILIVLVAIVLGLVSIFELMNLAPAYIQETFVWVVLLGAICLIATGSLFWKIISHDVLKPLQGIRNILQEEEEDTPPSEGFGQMAEQVQALKKTASQAQEELDKSQESLRQAEKLAIVGKLAAGVAHSVRNPLTSVKLRLFSLERSLTLNQRQEEDFTVITEAIRHVDNIVSNFLEFSRRPHLKLQKINVEKISEATLKLLENRLETLPVSVAVKRAKNLPVIDADPEQLREAMLNILLNACEAMDYCGNLKIEEYLDNNNGKQFVCIRIQDSGAGISSKDLEEIFTPFFSTKTQGTGLGLPIARGILQEHGGDIDVESSNKTGTVFTLKIPVPEF